MKKSNFFITVHIEDKDGNIVYDEYRKPIFTTFEDVRQQVVDIIVKTHGDVAFADIESMQDGIGCVRFVNETSFNVNQCEKLKEEYYGKRL